jgi:sialate O-acetylesterase
MDLKKEVNLRGRWKFEIGDDPRWAAPDWDDQKWETIYAPANWEEQNFPGYDGYAWYRKSFQLNRNLQTEILYLLLGQIDDVDQVFVNGKLVGGSGQFPPDYQTAYNKQRIYYLPAQFLNFGSENLIAVRVFDQEIAGGIVNGDLGLFSRHDILMPEIDLSGSWRFATGDDKNWARSDFDDSEWHSILVPGFWEEQGFADYDGMAWYRRTFRIPRDLTNQRLILLLGKIDDTDEIFLNGTRIGSTGPQPDPAYRGSYGDWYRQERAYILPTQLLKPFQENVIAIRVFDAWVDGGIYDLPVGITTRQQFSKKRTSKWNWDDFFRTLFNY